MLRELRIYYGGRGVWWHKEVTSNVSDPGVAVGVLHNGSSYPDDLSDDGMIYHYPVTDSPGTDRSEIEATKNACRLELPVFTISQVGDLRTVYFGFVRYWDDDSQEFLIEFTNGMSGSPPPLPPPETAKTSPFEGGARKRRTSHTRRPAGQQAFAFKVKRRFGSRCTVCGLGVSSVLEAAHIVGVSDGGSMGESNGLPMCSNHHRMWDDHLFGVNPDTLAVESAPSTTLAELQVTNPTVPRLRNLASREALCWRWGQFSATHDTS